MEKAEEDREAEMELGEQASGGDQANTVEQLPENLSNDGAKENQPPVDKCIRRDMTQFEIDLLLNQAENAGSSPAKTAGALSSHRGMISTFQAKEKQKAAHYLGIENADLLNGVINNDVLIPSTYFDKTLE